MTTLITGTSAASTDVSTMTGTNAGAMVPYISEWVQGSTTATYTLVGQVLYNGQTNWVGYNDGDAYYLATTSAPGAQQTTLDGMSYFVSSGDAPSGYLVTDGNSPSQTASSDDTMTTSMSDASSTSEMSPTMTGSSTASESESQTSSGSGSAETSQPGAGNRLSVFSVGIGMTLFTALVFGVMA